MGRRGHGIYLFLKDFYFPLNLAYYTPLQSSPEFALRYQQEDIMERMCFYYSGLFPTVDTECSTLCTD